MIQIIVNNKKIKEICVILINLIRFKNKVMKKYIYILCISVTTIYSLNAQNIVDENTNIIKNYFALQQDKLVINNQHKNLVELKTPTDITVLQEGDYNNVIVNVNQENKQSLIQKGNNNNFEYYTYYNNIESFINVKQSGDNNDIQIFGQNNISKNMKIDQNTSDQTIIIMNY